MKLMREIEPFTGLLCAVRLKLTSGESYVGIGTMLRDGNCMIRLEFEWLLRLVTDSTGKDGFFQGKAIPVEKSLQTEDRCYTMSFRPVRLIPSDSEWQELVIDEGILLLSFDGNDADTLDGIKAGYLAKYSA